MSLRGASVLAPLLIVALRKHIKKIILLCDKSFTGTALRIYSMKKYFQISMWYVPLIAIISALWLRGQGRGFWNTKSTIDPRWRRTLAKPMSMYALSSFFYSVLGVTHVIVIVTCPGSSPVGWPACFGLPEAFLVTLQGFWSFLSDVRHVGKESWAHPLDRLSAVCLTALQIWKYGFYLRTELKLVDIIWTGGTLLFGIVSKLIDNYALFVKKDEALYARTHFLWHAVFPIGFGSYVIYLRSMTTTC